MSIAVGIFCLIAISISSYAVLAAGESASYEEGLKHYENNETDKAIEALKESLAASFTEPVSRKLQQAGELAQNGKADEAEAILLSLFEDEETAARARYELALIYESRGELDTAVTLFRNAQVVIADNGASYVGTKKCKTCHMKQYKTWMTTKMAKTFEVLKPGVRADAKVKLKFDPKKDYTKDAKCLECHTTGFDLPGGYKIPEPGDSKAARRAKKNEGTTCEACHGPGSKYITVHKKIMTKKRKYTLDELYQAGQYKTDSRSCTTCHNRRNPTVGSDYHFDYEKNKAEDTHESFPLKYRVKE
jgi:tetratricopeptide (TPR) repeat protein